VPYEPPEPPPFDSADPDHQNLIALVRSYRSAGWFRSETGSDEDVARRARERWWAEWADEVDTEGTDDGIFICSADPERATWFDPEADTCEENATYLSVLDELAGLSGSAVEFTDVVEDWNREPGRVFVSFRLDGGEHELALHEFDDWVDPKVIEQLNHYLAPERGRFWVFDGGGQAFAITWATSAEAEALSRSVRATLLDRAPDNWPGVR
jgi:hypothetical protein